MKRTTIICVAVFLCLAGTIAAAQNALDLYQQALVQERAAGDLDKAIDLYQRAAQQSSGDRELAAKALIGAARCFEKLGQSRAAQLYEQVAQNYADQRDSAAMAQERLAAIQRANAAAATNAPSAQDLDKLESDRGQLSAQLAQLQARLQRMQELLRRKLISQAEADSLQAELARLQANIEAHIQTLPPDPRIAFEWQDLRARAQQSAGWQNFDKDPATTDLARFDESKLITVKGTITSVDWTNPEVHIHLESVESGGTKRAYHVSLHADPVVLVRTGVTQRTFVVGASVEVVVYQAKDPASSDIYSITLRFPDGRTINTKSNP